MMASTRWLAVKSAVALTILGAPAGCGDDDRPPPTDDGGARDTGPMDGGPADAGPADGGPDAGYVDVTLYTPVDLPDAELAAAAWAILAGETADDLSCATCHGLTLERMRQWSATTNTALDCIGTLDPNYFDQAAQIVDCFPGDTRAPDPAVMSLLTTAVHLDWFSRLLEIEYFDAMDTTEEDFFRAMAQMPRGPVPRLEQPEVDVVLSWVRRGMPNLEDQVTGGGGACVPTIGPEVAAHVAAMRTEGWAVLNRDRGLSMYGCAAGETGADCLGTLPSSDDVAYGAGWQIDGTLRILFETSYASSYWTRSSADGRYVSHGGGTVRNASVIDLQRRYVIPAAALYDPGFFPDNSGFVLQGVSGGGGGFCSQRLLDAEPSEVTFGEAQCSVFGAVGLYQHLGAVDGGDYWTVFGQFVSDNGGHRRTGPLGVAFGSRSQMSLVPLIYEGDRYSPRTAIRVPTPFEGDAVISPSSRLVLSRQQGTDGAQSGFVLRAIDATPSGTSYVVDAPVVANYCGRGSKVGFSFDERYMTFHRYIADGDARELGFTGPDDPAFAAYRADGGANIFLLELATGDLRRITHMGPGQYALFPHFRSDGWLYFIVRDPTDGSPAEYVVASDAALVAP